MLDRKSAGANRRAILPARDSSSELPASGTRRWVARRKAAVVWAVRRGELTLEAACERYALSAEEFASWERLVTRHGLGGLRVTRLKDFRQPADGTH